ncbi:MAG: hypothetical protein A2X04_17210 [Bacteroidetes bacterium GWF2_41_9]|nr:MAG: hypothetical protein A2X06_15900 [Bacteroidetes bacterium GWC2_40_22]OFY59633.1 MAG: hypothetical protein A2X04_17210 [Bacteroidetes bacterium GWF2_41_9]HAM10604.1 hypothetical protein [Bacteroidales bacterium]HBH84545.1 hypothetical protein [Bacteroidales bacterium]
MKTVRNTLIIFAFHVLIISILALQGCGELREQESNKLKGELKDALWITDSREWPVIESEMYGDLPAPLFRKEFDVRSEVKSAILYITAAGYYSAYINGSRIGKNILDPAWTDFSKRIYYSEYDLTENLKEGGNTLGTTLGNGFYNPLPLRMWGRRNMREELPVGKPSFIARLVLEYKNGENEEIITDNSWKHSFGAIRKNNVYLGEVYDGSYETEGWNLSGFNESSWETAVTTDGPDGKLQKAFFPPVRITDTINPVAVRSPSKGKYVIDIGVNFTGLYRIKLRGQKGDTITFRFGERIYENGELNPMTAVCGQIKSKGMGGPGSPDIAWQTDQYIFGDKHEVWYTPSFTYNVFRYMEVAGLKYIPSLTDCEGIAFNSDVETTGTFTSSNKLLNSVQEATRRTFTDNLISVQSDCPGREKFGYGGDLNATSESFIYNYDMQSFYRKTIYDWVDAMNDTIFIDTAPYVGIVYCGISWESAFIITQYKLLLYYNDIELIRELYDLDLKWMEKAARLHPDGIVNSGLADHEALQKVSVELIGTTHYLDCARIMTRFAAIMNDTENKSRFRQLAEKLEQMMLDMYWNKPVPDTMNKQTVFSTLLYYDIIPEAERAAAADSVTAALEKAPSKHFTTGIFGTKYILEALSAEKKAGLVFDIVNSTEYPGWGHMIDRGATTIWETWKESDNTYSNCHPMFGTVSEWYFRWLGGIQPDPEYPGFKRFNISPNIPEGLDYVKCSYRSPFGMIISNWEKRGPDHQVYEINVPDGTLATVVIPVNRRQVIKFTEAGDALQETPDGNRFTLKPGKYMISAEVPE